eukprot:5383269-Prymnesium_polylepis.1
MHVNVEWCDGSRHSFTMPRDANVTALKDRLSRATGLPRAEISVGTGDGVCGDRSLLRADAGCAPAAAAKADG